MKTINNLADLLINELEELRCGELRLQVELIKIIKKTDNHKLRELLNEYENISKNTLKQLDKIFDVFEITPEIMSCKVIKSLIEMAQKEIDITSEHHVNEAALILAIQCICHFKIANYGTLAAFSKVLDKEDLFVFLTKSLEEEKEMDLKLSKLAIESINKKAKPKNMEKSLI